MEIGLFQLENILMSPARYLFFDLREVKDSSSEAVNRLLARATTLNSSDVITWLKGNKVDESLPVVLICNEGALSAKLKVQLERSGYQNVYTVEGGVAGLLSELGA